MITTPIDTFAIGLASCNELQCEALRTAYDIQFTWRNRVILNLSPKAQKEWEKAEERNGDPFSWFIQKRTIQYIRHCMLSAYLNNIIGETQAIKLIHPSISMCVNGSVQAIIRLWRDEKGLTVHFTANGRNRRFDTDIWTDLISRFSLGKNDLEYLFQGYTWDYSPWSLSEFFAKCRRQTVTEGIQLLGKSARAKEHPLLSTILRG